MSFFNSISIRIPLALIGGILYSLLSYSISTFMDLSSDLGIVIGAFVFFMYCGSRLLLLLSGVDSPYYSKRRGIVQKSSFEKGTFHQTAQWVGRFYHYHDIVLFVFLVFLSIAFLVSLVIDRVESQPIGNTFNNLWKAFTSSMGK